MTSKRNREDMALARAAGALRALGKHDAARDLLEVVGAGLTERDRLEAAARKPPRTATRRPRSRAKAKG